MARLHLSHYSRRERKWMVHSEAHGKDYMKAQEFQAELKARQKKFKERQSETNRAELSKLATTQKVGKRRPFLNTTPMNNPDAFRRVNRALQKQARFAIKDIQQSEWYNMREKFFYLDHTAEILENYRRLQENKIFDKVLHDER